MGTSKSIFTKQTPSYSLDAILTPSTSPPPTRCNPVELTSPISRSPTRPKTSVYEAFNPCNPQGHRRLPPTFPPTLHAILHYPFPIKSPCTKYLSARCSHTLLLFGATHHPTKIVDYKFCSPNVSASLANFPRRTSIPRLHAALKRHTNPRIHLSYDR